jgi:hypothetical protein
MILEGYVVPLLRALEISNASKVYSDPETEISIDYEFENGKFRARIFIKRSPQDNYNTVTVRATHVLQTIVDSYAFINGVSLRLIPERVVVEGHGTGRLILLGHRELSGYFREEPSKERIALIQDYAFADKEFALALGDLNQALSIENYPAIAAARAVEVVRNALSDVSKSESANWKSLREKLRVTKEFLTFVTDHSKGPRHGRRVGINGDDQHQTLARAWIVVDRYIDHMIHKKLDENLYPMLNELPVPSSKLRNAIGVKTA